MPQLGSSTLSSPDNSQDNINQRACKRMTDKCAFAINLCDISLNIHNNNFYLLSLSQILFTHILINNNTNKVTFGIINYALNLIMSVLPMWTDFVRAPCVKVSRLIYDY